MTNVTHFELLLLLMAAITGLELLARWMDLPAAAALVLGGLGLPLIPGTPDLALDPDLVLVLFLPPLLLAGAYLTSWRDFRANLRIILQLAVGAVIFTTAAVGVAAHMMVPALPWAACFALGAIVSPPDAVAAKAVLKNVSLPPRVMTLLEGESLVNDASGLVLFRFAVAAALTGSFSASHALGSFCLLASGGVAVGLCFGFVASYFLARLKDGNLAIVGTFLTAWTSYIAADRLGASGVLSTVACGLVVGWRQHEILSAVTRTQLNAVWEFVTFTLESTVFILIGLSLRGILVRLGGNWHAAAALWPVTAAVVAAVVVSRFIWIFLATYIPRAFIPALRRLDPFPQIGIPIVMSWAGMRGVVSLAAALSLPENMPGRDLILAVTFAVILVTVLLMGPTLGPLIRVLHIRGFTLHAPATLSESEAMARMAAVQLAAVEKRSLSPEGQHRHPRLVEQYGFRAEATKRFSASEGKLIPQRNEHFSVVLDAITAGRAEILRMHRAHEINDTVLNTLEEYLDLEEVTTQHIIRRS